MDSSFSDFNGDGQADLLWRHLATGENLIWHMNGVTLLDAAPVASVSDLTWRIVATGDFNADGKTDLVWRNVGTGADTGRNVFWLMDDAVRVTYREFSGVTDLDWEIVGAADLSHGDGAPDLLWHNRVTGDDVIWVMNGTTYMYYARFAGEPDVAWSPVGTGNYAGDGWTDLLWRDGGTGENRVWVMVGPGKADQIALPTLADTNWVIGPGPLGPPPSALPFGRNHKRLLPVQWRCHRSAAATSPGAPADR